MRRIRDDALDALERKRTHADGAALFSILPRRRSLSLLRLLVAYEIIFDFLDNVNERKGSRENGRQLHLALIEALDPYSGISDYYCHHLYSDDGGYLRALVDTCREGCSLLPAYSRVCSLLRCETIRTLVLGINHDVDPMDRDDALRRWVERECRATAKRAGSSSQARQALR